MGFLSGLFGGRSKSSSSSTTTTNQTTNTLQTSLSNVVADENVVAGNNNVINQDFTSEVGDAFKGLTDLVVGAFDNVADLTGETIKSLENTNIRSIQAVTEANQQVSNPTYNALANTVNKTIPLLMLGVGAFAVVKVAPTIIKGLK